MSDSAAFLARHKLRMSDQMSWANVFAAMAELHDRIKGLEDRAESLRDRVSDLEAKAE